MNNNTAITRETGLERLAAFAAQSGQMYASGRNTDRGTPSKQSTSVLSPFLRRRLITEQEVVKAVLDKCGPAAEKFVQEVFWRTYFKGYLETHPAVWTNYQQLVDLGQQRLDSESGFRKAYHSAISGKTGIVCFDDWAHELVEENWLHNHTRMWFASIWIFTLGLPWALGADFFMRHLIDGDPASNTLSWRWVAGLHTRGKAYAARAENISRYTDGRYNPSGLNESPVALEESETAPVVKLSTALPTPQGKVALLLHLDDLHPESLDLQGMTVSRVGGLLAHAKDADARVQQAGADATLDALSRAGEFFGCESVAADEGWTGNLPLVTPYAPVGPSSVHVQLVPNVRRNWDSQTWPHATRGFFQVKAALPKILEKVGVTVR